LIGNGITYDNWCGDLLNELSVLYTVNMSGERILLNTAAPGNKHFL
jgi:hypothetical protein